MSVFKRITIRKTYIIFMVMCVFFFSCTHKTKPQRTHIGPDRADIPILNSDSVTTLVSDSGITRYRISAPKWLVYDKAEPSYWLFPSGLMLEKFDEQMNIDASITADFAKYLDKEQLWELRGNVVAVNEQGEKFETPLFFWDQKTETVYSDSAITITRPSSVLRGIGFRGNQTLTQYTILNPTGYFPIED